MTTLDIYQKFLSVESTTWLLLIHYSKMKAKQDELNNPLRKKYQSLNIWKIHSLSMFEKTEKALFLNTKGVAAQLLHKRLP